MAKVYIVNQGCHDFSPAAKFGTLVYLTSGRYNLMSFGRMYRTMAPILKHSSPEDCIVLCGPTIMNIVATNIFMHLHNKLNILIYHVGSDGVGRYKRRNLIIPNEMGEQE